MAVFKYRPYYRYKPTASNPLLDELTEDEAERNLRLLNDDLYNHFVETGEATISFGGGVITITSELTERRCDEIVVAYLSSLHLLADKIPEQSD